jgi:outer membrane protein TolC
MKTFIVAVVLLSLVAGTGDAVETYSVAQLLDRIGLTQGMAEAEAEAAAMARKSDAAGGLPNLDIGYELMDALDPEMLTHRLGIRQELPLGGKRRLLRQSAAAEAGVALGLVSERRNMLWLELLSALNDYHYAESNAKARRGELDAMLSIAESTKARYATGSANLSELYLVEIEIVKLEGMIRTMEAMSTVARNQALDSVDLGFLDASLGHFFPRITRLPEESEADALFAKARLLYPVLNTAREELRQAQLETRLAGAGLYPDLMLEFSYSYKPSTGLPGNFSLGFGLNLPAFSADARKAEAGMAARLAEARAARLAGLEDNLYRSIRMLLAEAGAFARLIELYEKRIQPLRSDDLEYLSSAYMVGEASLGMALDSVRMNFTEVSGYLENRQSLVKTLLELEYLTGETLVVFEDGRME